MKKRVLLPSGKFATFKGKIEKTIVPSVEQKVTERKNLEEVGEKHGFDVNSPDDGKVLSDKDIELLKSGEMGLMAMVSLANTRKIEVPSDLTIAEDIASHLIGLVEPATVVPEPTSGKAIERMSIPEMRAYAKEHDVKIPSKLKKADDIRAFLLGNDSTDDL